MRCFLVNKFWSALYVALEPRSATNSLALRLLASALMSVIGLCEEKACQLERTPK